jgi:hypothetical protein
LNCNDKILDSNCNNFVFDNSGFKNNLIVNNFEVCEKNLGSCGPLTISDSNLYDYDSNVCQGTFTIYLVSRKLTVFDLLLNYTAHTFATGYFSNFLAVHNPVESCFFHQQLIKSCNSGNTNIIKVLCNNSSLLSTYFNVVCKKIFVYPGCV